MSLVKELKKVQMFKFETDGNAGVDYEYNLIGAESFLC